MSASHHNQEAVTSEATAHLGYALRSGENDWVVKNRYGHSIATIWSSCAERPETFRCDPLADILYADAVEAGDFLTVLDYALRNFTLV